MTLTNWRWLQLATLLAWAAALPAHAVLPTVPSPVTSPVTEAIPLVGASSLLQAGLGMLLVLGLIFLLAWMARRFGLQRLGLGGSQAVKVISSAMLGQRGERVVVVEVGATWLVLGVTASQINTLHTLPAPELLGSDTKFAAVRSTAPGGRAEGSANLGSDPKNSGAHSTIGLFAQKLRDALNGKPRTL